MALGDRLFAVPDNLSKDVDDARNHGLGNGIVAVFTRFWQSNADARKKWREEGAGFRRR